MRERSQDIAEIPVMCSGCKKFIAKSYKSRHQLVCRKNNLNPLVPVVAINTVQLFVTYLDNTQGYGLLTTLNLDEAGNYVKSDPIIFMVGARSHTAIKRNKRPQGLRSALYRIEC